MDLCAGWSQARASKSKVLVFWINLINIVIDLIKIRLININVFKTERKIVLRTPFSSNHITLNHNFIT